MIDVERLKHDRDYWGECDPTGGEATHYCAGGGPNPWVKDGHFWQDDKGCWRNSGLKIFIMPNPIPRPTRKQWSGPEDGLPPVGTECEVDMSCAGGWVPVTIVHYAGGRIWVDAKDGGLIIWQEADFRPIKSEKERVVDYWSARIMEEDCDKACEVIANLYDLGALKMPEEYQ